MNEDELYELKGQIDALQIVVSMLLNDLSDQQRRDYADRLHVMEKSARSRGALSSTLETLRAFRETISG